MCIDDTLCDVIGCYGYDVNTAAAAAQRAKDETQSGFNRYQMRYPSGTVHHNYVNVNYSWCCHNIMTTL